MAKEFRFQAASIGGKDNSIVILIDGARSGVDEGFVEQNDRTASRLAEQLALWLTPATINKLAAKLVQMDYGLRKTASPTLPASCGR